MNVVLLPWNDRERNSGIRMDHIGAVNEEHLLFKVF